MIRGQYPSILFLCIFVFLSGFLQAQIFVDIDASGADNGSSWNDAYSELQVAMDNALAGDEIWVAEGVYKPTEIPTGFPTGPSNARFRSFHLANKDLKIYGGFNGSESLLSQRNWRSNPTILSGDFNGDDIVTGGGSTLNFTNLGENAFHVLITLGLSSGTEIDGFTITGGNANSTAMPVFNGELIGSSWGAGIYNKIGLSPVLKNLVLTANKANLIGGGVFNDDCSPTFSQLTIYKNQASAGGGIFNQYSDPTFINLNIAENLAVNGGGMFNNYSSPVIINTNFSTNSATQRGGGIDNENVDTISLINTLFYGNTATFDIQDIFNGFGVNPPNFVLSHCAFEDYVYGAAPGCISLSSSPFLNLNNPKGNDNLWMTVDDGFSLDTGSVCIGAGTGFQAPLTEIAGNLRPSPPSIGAYDVPCIPPTSIDSHSVCDSMLWIDGNTYTSSTNTPVFVYSNPGVCDSIVILNLSVNNSNTTDVYTACDSLTWIDGITYYSSNDTATQVLTNSNGCDSIVNLDLSLNYSDHITDIQTACDSFLWIDGNTYTNSTNTPTHALTNLAGCDSIISLNLTINYSYTSIDTQTACDAFTWIDGNTYTSSTNTPSYTMTTANGCDSTITLNLTLNNSSTFTDSLTACDSLTWIDGNTYISSTSSPTVTLTNAAGCDSVVSLYLNIFYTNQSIDTLTACDSLTWIDGITYTSSTTTPTHTLVNSFGCDSIVSLHLTVNNSSASIDQIADCTSVTWLDGNTYTAPNNTATFTTLNSTGCDSVISLDFSILPETSSIDTQVSCGPFTWIDGNTYTSSNDTATYTVQGSNTCDSTITLDLTVNSPSSSIDVVSSCESYTWIDGLTYTSSNNTASVILVNGAGCDSVVTLDLSIVYNSTTVDTHTACDQFTWIDGNTYLSSNNSASYTFAGDAANGCDSIVYLDLTLKGSEGDTYILTQCDSFTWVNGTTYYSSIFGESYVVPNVATSGCDSLYFLDLTIISSGYETDVITSCGPYTWIDGITYTSSNNSASHVVSGASVNGCDLIKNLDLTIGTTPSIAISSLNGSLSATAGLNNYQWYRNGQLIPGATAETYNPQSYGVYTCSTSNGTCEGFSNGIVITLTGINEISFKYVSIYPNPVNDYMRIDLGGELLESIRLIDVAGQVLATLDADKREFYLGDFAQGMYFLELKNQDKRSMIKIILK